MSATGGTTHPTGGAGTGPGRESDDSEGPQGPSLLREAIAAAHADETEILRELADLATEPTWPTTDTRGE